MNPNTLSLIRAVPALGALLLAVPAGAAFIDNNNGTVTDDQTGLMWDKCSWGQAWTGTLPNDTCSGTAATQNWADALARAVSANNNTHRGYNDWRLPSKNELESLVDRSESNPAIDTAAFPNMPPSNTYPYNYYWTSTTYAPDPARAWVVGFLNGNVLADDKDFAVRVRLVRSGQLFDDFDFLQTMTMCAILGDQSVMIRGGSNITADPANICSNGPLSTGAKVTVDTNVWSMGDMKLGDGTEVGHEAFTNGNLSTGANVNIGFGDGPGDLDVDAGGNISLLGGARVEGECQYGGDITKGVEARCGTEVKDTNLPFTARFALPECRVTAPAAGSPNITTPPKSTAYCAAPLAAGDYGNVSFGASNCVALASGVYHFQSLTFGAKTQIQIPGPVTVHVVDKLLFADGVQMTLTDPVTAEQVLYLVDGNATADPEQRGGAQTVLYGTICGPGSRITIGDGSTFTGSLVGKTVTLGAQVTFTAAPAPLP